MCKGGFSYLLLDCSRGNSCDTASATEIDQRAAWCVVALVCRFFFAFFFCFFCSSCSLEGALSEEM